MNEREFLEFARAEPVFTTRQVASSLGDRGYSWVFLNRMVQKGLVKRIKRGYYSAYDDPVIYASHIQHPSYISLWYAFQYHGATTQLPRRIEVMAKRGGAVDDIDFIATKHMWGYGPVNYGGHRIFMADIEKAIIDAVCTQRMPVDEIRNAVALADKSKLEKYALKMPVNAMKMIGFVLESSGMPMERLHDRIRDDRNYACLHDAKPGNRWRVRTC